MSLIDYFARLTLASRIGQEAKREKLLDRAMLLKTKFYQQQAAARWCGP